MAAGSEDIYLIQLNGGIKNEDLEENMFNITLRDDIEI